MTNEEMRAYVRTRSKIVASGCWEWALGLDEDGYGRSYASGRAGTHRAHRLSFAAFKHEIPDGLVVMHACDNPCCVNPDHLSVGTQLENIADSREKRRGGAYFYPGQDNPKSLLTDNDVRRIRVLKLGGLSHSRIGSELRCSKTLVTLVVTGQRWAHVV